MRSIVAVLAFLGLNCQAFAPNSAPRPTSTKLDMKRRDMLTIGAFSVLMTIPKPAQARPSASSTFFWDDKIELVNEEAQQATGDRLDLNAAFVGDYKALPGLFPHAAGKIASNGPYSSVKDIYKIEGLTDNDVALFKKYEKYFTTNPPGRVFNERINGRVST